MEWSTYFYIVHTYLLCMHMYFYGWGKKELGNIIIFAIGNKIFLSIKNKLFGRNVLKILQIEAEHLNGSKRLRTLRVVKEHSASRGRLWETWPEATTARVSGQQQVGFCTGQVAGQNPQKREHRGAEVDYVWILTIFIFYTGPSPVPQAVFRCLFSQQIYTSKKDQHV